MAYLKRFGLVLATLWPAWSGTENLGFVSFQRPSEPCEESMWVDTGWAHVAYMHPVTMRSIPMYSNEGETLTLEAAEKPLPGMLSLDSPKDPLLISFSSQPRVTEGVSLRVLPWPDWPLGVSMRLFLGCWLMWRSLVHCYGIPLERWSSVV